jgi:dUTP pyrophosphatase
MKKTDVYIRLEEGSKLPHYASSEAAGCDLYATEDMALKPGERKVMPMKFVVAIENDIEIQIRPRSGLSLKTDLRIPNSPGTIDSDYRDMVGVIIENTYNIANLPYQIAGNPNLLKILDEECTIVSLLEYLKSNKNTDTEIAEVSEIHTIFEKDKMSSILDIDILIDKKGNPYGTIYIKKGDRIAQMIFSECRHANFITHDKPETIGKNRGGGFGHSGISSHE